ncbi:MAG: LLM class F420-dependent oxidoreductase [Chloroflexi bacterium]|nr:LLM class F420-dependent oxidoreductase [Chloroflexota bacterium]
MVTSRVPIKFGVSIGQERVTWPELKEAAALIQELGFDSLWCHDHLIPSDPGLNQGPCLESTALLGALSVMTKDIRIGCMVAGNTYRNPVLLAKSATTVDIMSGGRLIFGIGAAWFEQEHTAYNFPFYTVRERIDRLAEAVEMIKLLWESDGPVSYQGRYYSLEDAPFDPKPIQKPHPPILIAGGGEKRTLSVVARWADAMNVFGTPEMTAHKFRVLEQHCKAIGRDPAEIEKTVNVSFIPPEKIDEWNEYMKRLSVTMPDAAEAKKATAVVGDMDVIEEWVRGQVEVGAQHVIFTLRSPYPFDSLREFARKVMPKFK